jgi:hypothetical protein
MIALPFHPVDLAIRKPAAALKTNMPGIRGGF